VPSSTSSSERRIPGGDWRGTWLVGLGLAIGLTWWFEHTTRAHHQRPSVKDDAVWWAVHRRMVGGDRDVVAFLGSSRMELAYDADAFAEAAPNLRGVQLAIDGVSAFAPLADLADDDSFTGIAVVDIAEWDVERAEAAAAAKPYVERAHALWRAPGALVNRYLAGHAQSHLAVLSVGGRELIAGIGARKWPEPKWVVSERDRTFHGDYSLADAAALQKRRDKALTTLANAAPSPDKWLQDIQRVESDIAKIRARGGEVVFVHLPISGKLAELADQRYPRERYWNAFAQRTQARTIYWRDVPAMARLECPDFMHLDQKDQAVFTRALMTELSALRR
jgi:hypothetical protein